MRTRTKGQENKRMKRFRQTGSMLKDPSKGSSLRRDLGKGAADIKTAFKKIKDAGKSLTRGTKDLTATRVMQGPAAGSSLIAASKSLFPKKDIPKKETAPQFTKTSRMQNQKDAAVSKEAIDKWKATKPQMSDFRGTGRRITPNEREQYNKALNAWKAKESK